MCGRTACTLAPDVIAKGCSHVDPNSKKHKKAEWREHPTPGSKSDPAAATAPSKYQYYPSANMPPTAFSPVLFNEEESEDWLVQPMMFSLIPHWAEEPKSHGLSTNNCRLEGLATSKVFKRPLTQRRVCAIPCQGFYEWKTTSENGQEGKSNSKQPKQPYLIFMPQDKDVKLDDIGDNEIWNVGTWNEETGWTGPKLLMMAGLYDIWESADGSESVYSFTIITMESNESLSWLHHRMPAILETPEELYTWLNPKKGASIADMIKVLKPATSLDSYPVSTKVNNARCHDMDCTKRINLKEKKPNTFMDNWLKRTPKVKHEEDHGESKKAKLEPEGSES